MTLRTGTSAIRHRSSQPYVLDLLAAEMDGHVHAVMPL